MPWKTVTCQYATPFGLLFAFFIAVLISDYIPKLNIKLQVLIVICALIMNQLVCQYALARESTYQYDTNNLIKWMSMNSLFYQNKGDFVVQCNADEPSSAIPSLINRKYHLRIKRFYYSNDPEQLIDGKKCDFYLYGSRFSGIEMSKLATWSIVFLSKNWIMYYRPIMKGRE
jgi:hypothetical protein